MVSEAPNGPRPVSGTPGKQASAPNGAEGARSIVGSPAPSPRLLGSESEEALPLRLALTRGSLGVELNQPWGLGPLRVTELALSLPDLRYPLDLSKGVKQFRTRRGRLQRLVIQISLAEAGTWLAEQWAEVLGEALLGVRLWPLSPEAPNALATQVSGLGVGLYSATQSLAFDLLWCPQEEPRLVLDKIRAAGVEASAVSLALRAMASLVGAVNHANSREQTFQRRGRMILLGDVPAALCRRVLPECGYRVPATDGLGVGGLEVNEGTLELVFDVDQDIADSSRAALLTLEAAQHLRPADDAVLLGDMEQARVALLDVIAMAPGLSAAVTTLAELDVGISGREEAALATLDELGGGAEAAGVVGARALMATRQEQRALSALVDAARKEPFGPLAAQLHCLAARHAPHVKSRVECLDRAVARAPHLASARWYRFEDRVRRGDVAGAVADAQHLELTANSIGERRSACLRAGRFLAEAGHGAAARRFLEKALRYAPDDAAARAALGRLFASLGMRSRAVTLLQSALAGDEPCSSSDSNVEKSELFVDLARLLADLGDYPQAVARLRQISARSSWAVRARRLEADYCERLGDQAGASRAYARLREMAELGWFLGQELLDALRRGAAFEEERGELAVAERHLYAAVSLAPADEALKAEYRRVAALSAR